MLKYYEKRKVMKQFSKEYQKALEKLKAEKNPKIEDLQNFITKYI